MERQQGFTLFELMVTIAVAAVIVSFGVPGFISLVQNNRATTHSNDVVTAMNLARSEATRRGGVVALCSSTNGTTCSGSNNWSTGFIVLPAGGQVVRAWPARSGGANVLSGNVSQISFQARGSLGGGAAPELQIRVPDCRGDQGRDVEVNPAGRISVTRVNC